MKRSGQVLVAALLFGSIEVGGHPSVIQDSVTATVAEKESRPPRGTATFPRIAGVSQTQAVPGQSGTIPERIQPPNASREEMVISPDEIKRAQEALKAKGYDPGAVSGRMHAKTQEALREFQKKNNLPATGVLDQKTAEKLGVTVPEGTGSPAK